MQDYTNIQLNNSKYASKPTGAKKIMPKNHTDQRAQKIENETEQFAVPTIPRALVQEISSARTAKKLTQKDLANRLNIPHTVYTTIENGKALYDPPTKKIIQNIEKQLGVKFAKK
tara:strand:+ start:200 stop:544 length:345 start_codon:yes stop_codon:yes gene_type:complete